MILRGVGVTAAMLMVAVPAALAAVPAAGATSGPSCPNTGLRTVPAVLATAKGKFRYDLEVAATADQQACGLMFRKAMKRTEGMWFPFETPRSATFWMENTPLSLDLIFVGPDKRVLSVTSNAKPMSRMMIDSNGIASGVIELNAGEAAKAGVRVGDKVSI
ncbi:hypothetical protein GCM10011529_01850 [Polymorphobacter glacialis]|uniref:DUF192 domain-containing protein n=1 Tax=Sandarakinorhabdus glacialis TaxID=1614636 RepID=A0A916ZIJ2_9SPHN|nr:DUF192 domain-containing protein [Polymorphobacter glacialis]GGD99348.1 hypothetical protein GCM10011529_01850 [Polymorphobacter glacialis]